MKLSKWLLILLVIFLMILMIFGSCTSMVLYGGEDGLFIGWIVFAIMILFIGVKVIGRIEKNGKK
jgi:hypothetical protein